MIFIIVMHHISVSGTNDIKLIMLRKQFDDVALEVK